MKTKHHHNQVNFIDADGDRAARFDKLRSATFWRQAGTFMLSVLVLLSLLNVANKISSGISAKGKVLGAATEGIAHLKQAQALIQQNNIADSQKQLASARDSFISAKQTISNLGDFVNSLLSLSPQGKDAASLLNAGEAISNAAMNFDNLYSALAGTKISPQGIETKDGLYQTIGQSKTYFNQANKYLAEASQDLSQVSPDALPQSMRDQFIRYKGLLDNSIGAMQQSYNLLGLVQEFLGPGQKTILVLFQNDNELRATGGFIGTYGYFKIDNGRIVSQKISSIYDLDGQLRAKVAPPGPLHDLTDHWGLRDSNWFANFPDSAKKAIEFYELEGHETPDAVVAATPQMFVDLLGLTGPVDFPKYGVTLNAENFRRTLQVDTSLSYDKSKGAPKQMLADLAPVLMQQLAATPKSIAPEVLSALLDNLNKKNILIYDRNPQVQQALAEHGWTGEIKATDRDYLAVVNSNLGGKKTDLNINQDIQLKSEVQPDGSIVNTLQLTRQYNKAEDDFKNIDYVRLLVPDGSTIISAKGFTQKTMHASDGSDYLGEPAGSFEVDPDIARTFGSERLDEITGLIVGKEAGKTEFAGWIETAPGQSSTVTISYKLPFVYGASAKHSLLVQKQPGSGLTNLDYQFRGSKAIIWSMPDGVQASDANLDYKKELISDTLIGFVAAP